jgi:hypothetical protein
MAEIVKAYLVQKNTKVIRQISTNMIVSALDRITRSDDSFAPAAAAIPRAKRLCVREAKKKIWTESPRVRRRVSFEAIATASNTFNR